MANTIQLKRSSVAGKIPDAGNVSVGEPVVNLTDQTLYTKNGSGDVIVIGTGILGNLSDVSNTSPSSGQVLTWDGAQWGPDTPTGSTANNILGIIVQNAFTANGTGTTYTLTNSTGNANSLIVFVDSVLQEPITNYTISGTILTFTSAPANGANIDVRYFAQDEFDIALGELNNVSNSAPLTGQALIWSGSEWAPSNVSTDANVISVNGYTGVVTLDTDDITEATNLYFTNTRARDAISVSGAGSYDNTTGVITITGGVTSVAGAEGAVSNVQLAAGITQTGILTTANVSEVTNLYYTDERVYSNVTQLGYITASSLNGYATNSQLSDYATTSLAGTIYNAANTAQTTAETAFNSSNTKVATVAGVTSTSISNTNLLDGILSVDGTGSNLDADLLDGQQGSYYLNATNISTGTLASARLPTSGVAAATYGNATIIPVFTVDTYGRITSASNVVIQTGSGTTVSATPPSSPNVGDKWIESGNLIEYTYISDGDSSQWIQISASATLTSDTVTITTADVLEDTNLYYTNARVYANVTQLGYATASSVSAAYDRANTAIDDVIIYSLLLSGM